MARGRWYPTSTVMGNGDVVIVAGTDQDSLDVTVPEVWSNGTIRRLTGADKQLPWVSERFPRARRDAVRRGGHRTDPVPFSGRYGSVEERAPPPV